MPHTGYTPDWMHKLGATNTQLRNDKAFLSNAVQYIQPPSTAS
jgi:hypothetical protein